MKHLLLIAVCTLLLAASCNDKGKVAGGEAADSTAVAARDTQMAAADQPMFLYYFDERHMQVVYWDVLKEPTKEDTGDEHFAERHRDWAFQNTFRQHAARYTKLLTAPGKTAHVKLLGEVLTNPDGEELYSGELHSRAGIPSPGMQYAFADNADAPKPEFACHYLLLTDDYLKSHKALDGKTFGYPGEKPFPAAVILKLEEQYGMKCTRSEVAFRVADRYSYGVVQFAPKDKKVVALEVVTDGQDVCSVAVEGFYESAEEYGWNVDDDGQYFSSNILGAFEGADGLELYFTRYSPESCAIGVMRVNGGKLLRHEYGIYQNLIDEPTPLWKKDLALMRKLYLDDDPHENKGYTFSKRFFIDVDDDGTEEVWLRDKDGENGALFTNNDGKVQLIGVETNRQKPSFRQPADGTGYVVISGSAGGSPVLSRVVAIRGSQVAHEFSALEVEGELSECTLDGKPVSPAEGRGYLQSLPAVREPFLYWGDVE